MPDLYTVNYRFFLQNDKLNEWLVNIYRHKCIEWESIIIMSKKNEQKENWLVNIEKKISKLPDFVSADLRSILRKICSYIKIQEKKSFHFLFIKKFKVFLCIVYFREFYSYRLAQPLIRMDYLIDLFNCPASNNAGSNNCCKIMVLSK